MVAQLQLEIVGAQELADRFRDPSVIERPFRSLLGTATSIGQRSAKKRLAGGQDIAVHSIRRQWDAYSGRVWSAMPLARALSIEEGQPAGAPIHSEAVKPWGEAVGHPDPAFVIARGIRQRGVRGRFFMRSAKESVQNRMPDLLRRAGDQIVKRLAGKG